MFLGKPLINALKILSNKTGGCQVFSFPLIIVTLIFAGLAPGIPNKPFSSSAKTFIFSLFLGSLNSAKAF